MKAFCLIAALANLAMWFSAGEHLSLIISNVWAAACCVLTGMSRALTTTTTKGDE